MTVYYGKRAKILRFLPVFFYLAFFFSVFSACISDREKTIHLGEIKEIKLIAVQSYANPRTDVKVWVDLEGQGFEKRCYGFWNGENEFVVRILADRTGVWTWRSGSDNEDAGLSGRRDWFKVID